jgi:hypothetical protein
MGITEFRITNFRSIVDTGWRRFSSDGVTALVGQNESGKTSILEAICCTLGSGELTEDDLRSTGEMPEVRFKTTAKLDELSDGLGECPEAVTKALEQLWKSGLPVVRYSWTKTSSKFEKEVCWDSNLIEWPIDAARNATQARADSIEDETSKEKIVFTEFCERFPDGLSVHELGTLLHQRMPKAILFNSESGFLPSQIEIDPQNNPLGVGIIAAKNFLALSGLNLDNLISAGERQKATQLQTANDKINRLFDIFWTQLIGKSDKLELKCELKRYDNSKPERAGKPYLEFWINDGVNQLYPKQRSQGLRWFLSFFLQLEASKLTGAPSFYLLDEPGANLHPKAQKDVLKFINKLGKNISVIYSTHSPDMLEYDTMLFRVLAVQRNGEEDSSPTEVVSALDLASASTDTLTPILSAMGANITSQNAIHISKNILLEEPSAYFYHLAFRKLTGLSSQAHFLSATGVTKLPQLVMLLLGWGVKFGVVVDDDRAGREIAKTLKHQLFGNDDIALNRFLLKLPDCPSIEDVFSSSDFQNKVVGSSDPVQSGSNTEFLSAKNLSKPIVAYQFWEKVKRRELSLQDLENSTQQKIREVSNAVEVLLGEQ